MIGQVFRYQAMPLWHQNPKNRTIRGLEALWTYHPIRIFQGEWSPKPWLEILDTVKSLVAVASTPYGDYSNQEIPLEKEHDNNLVIAYIKGQPLIGMFKPEQTLLTQEHCEVNYSVKERKSPTIGQFMKSLHRTQFVQSPDLWIRAKTLVSQWLEQTKRHRP